jgi:hypothetical protein
VIKRLPKTFIKKLRVTVPLAVSIIILFVLFRKIDAGQTIEALRGCDIRLVALAVLISMSINIFFGAVKWRRILVGLGCRLPLREILAIRTGCIPFKVLFPLKSAELLKAVYLDRRGSLSFTRSIGSLILDKALNLLVLILIAIVGLTVVDINIPEAFLVCLLILILLVVYSVLFRRGLIGLASRMHPRFKGVATGLLSGFAELGFREKMILVIYSFVYQSSEFFNTFILLKAVGVTVPLFYLMAVIPVIMVVNNLPITVLGLGTREITIVFFFAGFGPATSLLSAGILISLVEHVLPVITGILFIRSFHTYFTMKDDVNFVETAEK